MIMSILMAITDYCHITGIYRGSAHRDCNTKVKLNYKIPVVFHSLKSCVSHLIMPSYYARTRRAQF